MVPGYDHGVRAGQAALSKPHCGLIYIYIYIYIYHSLLSQTAWRVNALRGAGSICGPGPPFVSLAITAPDLAVCVYVCA